MITITNRDLEAAIIYSHPQIKRWAVAFLEADDASGQHSGVPRRYNFEQAFRIFLGGRLVRNLRFTLIEARQILNDITLWMKEKGWTISECVNFEGSNLSGECVVHHNAPWMELKIDILHRGECKFSYYSKITIDREKMKEPNRWQERYDLEYFGDGSIGSIGPVRSIDIMPTVNWLVTVFSKKGSE